jgi:IS5 family transposase
MGQPGFFDLSRRYEGLDAKNDPLVAIAASVPFEAFRPKLKAALIQGGLRVSDGARKSTAGRKPWDEVLIFKALVLQALYNLSDDQAEYQLRDRLSFMRFLGLGLEDAVPDAKTLWLYREALAKAGAVEELFDQFDGFLKDKGYLAMGGQIIDATIVPAPRQHNSRDDNTTIKTGGTPADWKPAKTRQKDRDARWTKKHGRSYFGYKACPRARPGEPRQRGSSAQARAPLYGQRRCGARQPEARGYS